MAQRKKATRKTVQFADGRRVVFKRQVSDRRAAGMKKELQEVGKFFRNLEKLDES